MHRDDALHHYSQRNAINNVLATDLWPPRSLPPKFVAKLPPEYREILRRIETMGIVQPVDQLSSKPPTGEVAKPPTGEVANALSRLRSKVSTLQDVVKMLNNAFQPVLRAEATGGETKPVPVVPAVTPLGGVLVALEQDLDFVGESLGSILARIEL